MNGDWPVSQAPLWHHPWHQRCVKYNRHSIQCRAVLPPATVVDHVAAVRSSKMCTLIWHWRIISYQPGPALYSIKGNQPRLPVHRAKFNSLRIQMWCAQSHPASITHCQVTFKSTWTWSYLMRNGGTAESFIGNRSKDLRMWFTVKNLKQ